MGSCWCGAARWAKRTGRSRPTTLGRGRFQTCDLAEFKDGVVYLRGRTNDQINVAGRKVSPATIEQALREHEAVNECLVFGVPSGDADRIDLIVACVTADRRGTTEELKQFLLRKLPAGRCRASGGS